MDDNLDNFVQRFKENKISSTDNKKLFTISGFSIMEMNDFLRIKEYFVFKGLFLKFYSLINLNKILR